MATNTTNYNLIKPDATDFYDINVQNQNMDVIDVTLKSVKDSAAPYGFVEGQITHISSPEDLDTHLDTVYSNIKDGKTRFLYVRFGTAHPVLGGADRIFRIDRITEKYGIVHTMAYTNDGAGVVLEHIRSRFNGTWTSWARNYNTYFKPTATDIGAAPSGFGLGSLCKNIDNQDIVAIARSGQSGFYAGANVTNAPDTAYHMYLVICFSNQVSKVLCFDFYNLFIKMAAISFNTWTGWKSVVETTVIPASVE